ncbi:hypothetical protein KIPB_016089, partial [Kipferlia bialata]|eukprot:g16089.t1
MRVSPLTVAALSDSSDTTPGRSSLLSTPVAVLSLSLSL